MKSTTFRGDHGVGRVRPKSAIVLVMCLPLGLQGGAQEQRTPPTYKVLQAVSEGNLMIFPVVAARNFDTGTLITLDEGISSGQVVVMERGADAGLVRSRPNHGSEVWSEQPPIVGHPSETAQVNELVLMNHSDKPLILLAGEIVTGGKQDRVVGKDRIIPARSQPVALDVFCVEPHRWNETSLRFNMLREAMAQPSIRQQAMANRNQQQVWEEVAKSRSLFEANAPMARRALGSTSSYATTMQNDQVMAGVDALAVPAQRAYEKLLGGLRGQKALGAVVAVNGQVIWADVFASSALLEKYWLKLIRSYAAEAVSTGIDLRNRKYTGVSVNDAQAFLDDLNATRENIETEPRVYRNTELVGSDFTAFILTSLLPNAGFNVHLAKMANQVRFKPVQPRIGLPR